MPFRRESALKRRVPRDTLSGWWRLVAVRLTVGMPKKGAPSRWDRQGPKKLIEEVPTHMYEYRTPIWREKVPTVSEPEGRRPSLDRWVWGDRKSNTLPNTRRTTSGMPHTGGTGERLASWSIPYCIRSTSMGCKVPSEVREYRSVRVTRSAHAPGNPRHEMNITLARLQMAR